MNILLQKFGYLRPEWRDLVEILIVAAVLYRFLIVLTGTRAIQILMGVVPLVGAYFLARVFSLDLIQYLLENLFQFGAIAALVVFQPELRAALAHLGQNRILRLFNRLEAKEVAEELTEAAEELSRLKLGAIIAIEQDVGLGEYAETGTAMQAGVNAALLVQIFTPYGPLHDGAVIVRGDTIVAAGAILPLTQYPVTDKSLGTRHRAALGLSEESDALVVVVSEETSQISLAVRGRLERGLDRDRLLKALSTRSRNGQIPG